MPWSVQIPRDEVWRRRKLGEAFSEIGRAIGAAKQSVHNVVVARGGVAPTPQRRRPGSLELSEREEISRGLAAGKTLRRIAGELGRAPSTISREINRNQSQRGYRAHRAEYWAQRRARRPKPCLLERHPRLREVVIEKLQRNWSPRQISGYLIEQFPDDPSMRVSPETIYRSLYIQARGVLKKDLIKHLRSGRRIRRPKAASARLVPAHGQILDAVRISQRPAEVEDRAVPGHWEGFVMLVKMPADDSKSIVDAVARAVQKLPSELRRSLTWDRGSEMHEHKRFTVATDVQVYFCDPHSPWQRGSNENTNGLLRQYFPKSTDLSAHSQQRLDEVARELNERPRETLGFRTPAAKLAEVLQ
jgi:IS30 family transposase